MATKLYPTLRYKMGEKEGGWDYFVIKMSMRDLAGDEVKFAYQLPKNPNLGQQMQRVIDWTRVFKQIMPYLANREDRFFSSIMVASLGGKPRFQGIDVTTEDNLGIFNDMQDHYGVLKFVEQENYYALDGQHRLAAIKVLIHGEAAIPAGVPIPKDLPEAPAGFAEETMSVVVVVGEEESDDKDAFTQKFRRLFTSLNRYAKPTDRDTNILMDDDDFIAITTRRIIEELPLFQMQPPDSYKVQLKNKNITGNKPYIISLQTLYDMNRLFLSNNRNEAQWGGQITKNLLQYRPEEEDLEKYFKECNKIWVALSETVNDLKKDPLNMRSLNEEECKEKDEVENNALFRPIFQDGVFGKVIRQLIDQKAPDEKIKDLKKIFKVFNQVDWSLFAIPWRGLLVTQNENGNWVMANEDRTKRVELAENLLLWMVGVYDYQEDEIDHFKATWKNYTLLYSSKEQEKMWGEFLKKVQEIKAS